MSGVFESIERHPVEYLPTGDRALLIAWVVSSDVLQAVLCLEDGRAVTASTELFKFDYRYSLSEQAWYDVSRITEDDHGDADQGDADDGGAGIPGLLPDPDRAGEGDPVDES